MPTPGRDHGAHAHRLKTTTGAAITVAIVIAVLVWSLARGMWSPWDVQLVTNAPMWSIYPNGE